MSTQNTFTLNSVMRFATFNFNQELSSSTLPTNNTPMDCMADRFIGDINIPIQINAAYISVEIAIAIFAMIFNFIIIYLYARNAYIRESVTNMYIISLATADFLVGMVGIPAAILTDIGLPENFCLCLFSTSILLQICTTSIFNLVAVTIDRHMAILRPLRYQTLMSKRKVKVIISLCWILGFFTGFVPLMGFNKGPPPKPRCFFLEVNNLVYLVFLFFTTIIFPSVFMAVVYFQIHKEIRRQIMKSTSMVKSRLLHKKSSSECSNHAGRISSPSISPLTSLCHMSSWRAEFKVIRSLVVVVTAFMVSWAPLYTINTIFYFRPCTYVPKLAIDVFICLSHLNSVWNPLIYAFGTKDFKKAIYKISRKRYTS